MYRDDKDNRTPEKRLEDIRYTLDYEPKLPKTQLNKITNLIANHSLDVFTLRPTDIPDFTGTIANTSYQIEAKSSNTSEIDYYVDTDQWRTTFINYLDNYFKSGVRIHNADYVLLIIKNTNQIFCINTKNISDFWLAGELN